MLASLRAIFLIDPLIVLVTIVMGSLSLGASLFDKTGRRQHRIARAWARLLLQVSGVRLVVEGVEKLDPKASYVLAANHMSLMDIPAVLATIPLEIRFFAKKGLFRIPLLGTHLKRAGHLPVVRGDPRASVKILQEAAQRLRKGASRPCYSPKADAPRRRCASSRRAPRISPSRPACLSCPWALAGHARSAAHGLCDRAARQGASAGGEPDRDHGAEIA